MSDGVHTFLSVFKNVIIYCVTLLFFYKYAAVHLCWGGVLKFKAQNKVYF